MSHMPTSVIPPNLYNDLTDRLDELEAENAAQALQIAALQVGGGGGGGGGTNDNEISALAYGIDPTGVANSRLGMVAAVAAAAAAKKDLLIPPGTYLVAAAGSTTYFDLLASNITIRGVKGQTWFKHPPGMISSTPIVRVNNRSNVTFDGIGFDGGWGATVGVTDAIQMWAVSTPYVLGEKARTKISNVTRCYVCIVAGTSAGAGTGPNTNGADVTDGTVHWMYIGAGSVDNHNHVMQTDPRNYGLMLRGGSNITVRDCLFRDIYGDAIWVGSCGDTPALYRVGATNVKIIDTQIDLTARDGVAMAQKCTGVTFDGCTIWNTYSSPIDSEPVDQPINDVTINNCNLRVWWNAANPARSSNSAITVVGGATFGPSEANFARNYRVTNNKCWGSIVISDAADVVVEKNRVLLDWAGYSYSGIHVSGHSDDVQILNNRVYDRCTEDPLAGGRVHTAAVSVQVFTSGAINFQPAGVRVAGNRIYARNGRHGIKVEGSGALADGSGTLLPGIAFTPTTVTDTTVTLTPATWTVDQWVGYRFRIGAAWASVEHVNLPAGPGPYDTLSLFKESNYTSAWRSPTGEEIATPAAGPGVLWIPNAYVTVEDNYIDCTDDGYGAGGFGIFIYTIRAGMRVKTRRNEIKNANVDGINVDFEDANRPIIALELADNVAWDDQITPTCTSTIRFVPTVRVNKLIMRNNQAGDGVVNTVSGLTTGTWLVNDGLVQEWAGFGTPEAVVVAPIGSTYRRLNGGAATSYYVKESGAGLNTGWVAK